MTIRAMSTAVRPLLKDVLLNHEPPPDWEAPERACSCGFPFDDYDLWLSHVTPIMARAVIDGRNPEAPPGEAVTRSWWAL